MKKDIIIPEVENVHIAAVPVENDPKVWNVFIVNNRNEMIDGVMVTSKGSGITKAGEEIKTSVMRHMVGNVPAKTAAKIETVSSEVFHLNNEFWVTFFADNKLMEKKFVFGSYTITKELLEDVPVMNQKGSVVW